MMRARDFPHNLRDSPFSPQYKSKPPVSQIPNSSSIMDRHSSKRTRDSSPPQIGNGEKRQCGGGSGRGASSSGGRLLDLDLDLDLDLSFGVFDFPWLKESLINSKSEDWKFEDSFDGVSGGTIETAFTEFSGVWCDLPDPWAVECEAVPPLDGGGTAAEGMDCVWRSLLNQPLQQRSSAL